MVSFGIFLGFVDNNKHIDYHQSHTLNVSCTMSKSRNSQNILSGGVSQSCVPGCSGGVHYLARDGWTEVWSILIYSAIWSDVLHFSYLASTQRERTELSDGTLSHRVSQKTWRWRCKKWWKSVFVYNSDALESESPADASIISLTLQKVLFSRDFYNDSHCLQLKVELQWWSYFIFIFDISHII